MQENRDVTSLIIVEDSDSSFRDIGEKILYTIEADPQSRYRIVVENAVFKEYLKKLLGGRRVDLEWQQDILNEKGLRKIDELAYRHAHLWHKERLEAPWQYRKVDLAGATEIRFKSVLPRIYKKVSLFTKVLERDYDKILYYYTDETHLDIFKLVLKKIARTLDRVEVVRSGSPADSLKVQMRIDIREGMRRFLIWLASLSIRFTRPLYQSIHRRREEKKALLILVVNPYDLKELKAHFKTFQYMQHKTLTWLKVLYKGLFSGSQYIMPIPSSFVERIRFWRERKAVRERAYEIVNKKMWEDYFAIDGISGWPVFKPFFVNEIKRYESYMDIIDSGYEWFKLYNFKGLIALHGNSTEFRLLFQIGKIHNAVSVTTAHGLVANDPGAWRFIYTDYEMVWGEGILKWYLDQGVSKERLRVIGGGFQLFDHERGGSMTREELLKAIRLPSDTRFICYLSSNLGKRRELMYSSAITPDEGPAIFLGLLESLKTHRDLYLVCKLHPLNYSPATMYERIPDIFDIEEDIKRRIVFVREAPILALLREASLVVGSCTTAILLAMYYNRPVIEANLAGHFDWPKIAAMGASFPARTNEEIKVLVDRWIDNRLTDREKENQRECLRNYLGEERESYEYIFSV